MIVRSYWMKYRDACDFLYAIEDREDADEWEDAREILEEIIEDRYQNLSPYGPGEDDLIVVASRFEQRVMDLIDIMNIAHETKEVETP